MDDIPSISITNEFSDNDDDNTENAIDPNVATDCENLGSDSDSGQVTTHGNTLVAFQKKRRSSSKNDFLTDCEDMDGSDSEDVQETNDVEEKHISLEEFLDQGFTDEKTKYNGKDESTHDGPRPPIRCHSPMAPSNLLVVDVDDGGLTDLEDMNDSGDDDDDKEEVEYPEIDLPMPFDENNTVESHDNMRSSLGQHHITTTDSSSSTESSGDEHTPAKSKRKQSKFPHSDTENILVSDFEAKLKTRPKVSITTDLAADEVLNVEISDDDDPETSEEETPKCIGVHFRNTAKELHKPGTPKFSKLLAVLQDPNEGLTDTENLNSSDDDEESKRCSLAIPPAVVQTDNAYLTDMEDMEGDENEVDNDEVEEPEIDVPLPKPVRQLIMVQETSTGAPVSRVLPLADNLSLAADVGYMDKGLTDTEDLSDTNEDLYDISAYLIDSLPEMEAGKITSCDKFATTQLSAPSLSNDPVTDTEDMDEVKDTRKKRHRHRHSNRHKHTHRLAVSNAAADDDGHTDVEEMVLSDQGHRRYSSCNGATPKATPMLVVNTPDDGGHTDVEVLSGDEDTVTPRNRRMQRNSSPNILNKSDWFNSATASRDSVYEAGKKCKSKSLCMNLPQLRRLSPTPDAGHTDIEEMARSGDDDEDEEADANRETPVAVHRHLDELNSTTHDSNRSVFDAHSERLNIKGHREVQEALTDTEFFEEEAKD